LAVIVLVVLVATGAVVAVNPFGGAAKPGVVDNGTATSLATVRQEDLSSQTDVGATLGYAGAASVVAPAGANAQALTQAEADLTAAQAGLAADQTQANDAKASTHQTLAQEQAAVNAAHDQLAADQTTQRTDCAEVARAAACAADGQAVSKDQAALTQADNALIDTGLQATSGSDQTAAKLAADQRAVSTAEAALAATRANVVNPRTNYTALPVVGQTISRGKTVYTLDGIPVPLWYGPVIPWRAFTLAMSDGPDVGELTANLIALGFGAGLTASNHFSAATQSAVDRWQAALGAPQTGTVTLGDVVVEPGPIIVRSVTPTVGAQIQPGQPVLTASSTTRQVTVALDAAQQSQVKAGDQVAITLPDSQTTPGVVASVGTVATTPTGATTPVVTVEVTPTDAAATGGLDQAPVEVSITTATVKNATAVPVDALLALSGGGYAVEAVDSTGVRHLVTVTLGLFDDATGVVQVTSSGLAAGQQIVVPAR
jgi:hypothetical protein